MNNSYPRFNVGDKVRVRPDLDSIQLEDVTPDMIRMSRTGEEGVITDIRTSYRKMTNSANGQVRSAGGYNVRFRVGNNVYSYRFIEEALTPFIPDAAKMYKARRHRTDESWHKPINEGVDEKLPIGMRVKVLPNLLDELKRLDLGYREFINCGDGDDHRKQCRQKR